MILYGGRFSLTTQAGQPRKLESPWVGPYIVTEVIPGGAHRLQDKKTGKDESNPWNAEQLRHFYA
jgi:hypothetical protein